LYNTNEANFQIFANNNLIMWFKMLYKKLVVNDLYNTNDLYKKMAISASQNTDA